MEELTRVIVDYVTREYLDADAEQEITAATPLISGGIVDSFSMVSLKRFLEKTYAIRIPDEEATTAAFDTADGIAALVRRIRERTVRV